MAKKLSRATLFAGMLSILIGSASLADPQQGGWLPRLFPSDNPWNTDISWAPVDWQSDAYINRINQSGTKRLHPDFGGDVWGDPARNYGFPYIVVDGWQEKVAVQFDYWTESDGVDRSTGQSYPFYPIPEQAIWNAHWIQGGPPGYVWNRDEDRHIMIYDRDNNHLYELYNVWFDRDRWQWVAGSGAFFDLNYNHRRPEGWTSADESGMSMLPGVLRYDEVYGSDEITHALRVSVEEVNGHVFPASHDAGFAGGSVPLGARLRLKADVDISYFPWEAQKIFRAFKRYGLIVVTKAWGDKLFISGTYDTRWSNDVLNPAFNSLNAWQFEVIQLGWTP